jgi:hypothetical protein
LHPFIECPRHKLYPSQKFNLQQASWLKYAETAGLAESSGLAYSVRISAWYPAYEFFVSFLSPFRRMLG